ncbi:rrp3 (nucleomorph) [Hemiselmis andersenii]|uniref:Rrp3 n=2 Tax=Hemiselmis andersenii TaxID=464988 RepID=A9BL22_HEMAN|nr:rrp3 [Hemiselmis andersenii]ABW98205.1 rrp3 [Hemiselmis andersenii]|mmetsp:Transcript_29692/g.69379  ORF Transcript_29692/g.69379 Transcript_29692/m.69379 type:complete len:399 (+) Transcript_29692:60-1256(+)
MFSFDKLGISKELCRICKANNFFIPTKIQAKVIPHALNGRDIIGYAQTGSGKTIAYLLPIIQNLVKKKTAFFSIILVPSRELAFQIASYFEAFGNIFGIKIVVLVGGLENFSQKALLSLNPHILICTPGRLIEHLEKFLKNKIKKLEILVIDEADRLFQLDFKKEFSIIFSELPKNKQSLFFSATMSLNLENLQKNNMKNPVKIQINRKYKVVKTLQQNYIFIPQKLKDCYFIYLCNEFNGSSILVFVDTQKCAEKKTLLAKFLGFNAEYLHGGMNQNKRLEILQKFRFGKIKILIATDLASRGLDIPNVDLVLNYDLPHLAKEYLHRVGRTARAGKSGRTINIVTQYDIHLCQKIETLVQQKFILLNFKLAHVLILEQTVDKMKQKVNFLISSFKKN